MAANVAAQELNWSKFKQAWTAKGILGNPAFFGLDLTSDWVCRRVRQKRGTVLGRICGKLAFVAALGLVLKAAGQTEHSGTDAVKTVANAFVPRQPSTAVFKITRVKTEADGTTSTQESTEVSVYSRRWMMNSTTTTPASGDQNPVTKVAVLDRQARTISRWTIPGDKVEVVSLPVREPGTPLCAASLSLDERDELPAWAKKPHPADKPVSRDLGIETIHGHEGRGNRTTITIPKDAVGNDEPLVQTLETWTAAEPGVVWMLRSITDNPWSGKMTKELEDLDLNEPNPAVFQPPADYKIVRTDVPQCPASTPLPVDKSEQ
jgi:hypothetical protein